MAWTTDQLISEVRRRLRLPPDADSGGVLDSDILGSANRAYLTQMLPFLRQMMEGFGQVEMDVPVVADQADYPVPANLLGGTFDDLLLIDAQGNEQDVAHIPATKAHLYRVSNCYAYSLFGGGVRLSPTPPTALGSLRFKGIDRPTLVSSSRGAQVTSVTSSRYVNVDGAGAFGGSGSISIDIRGAASPFRQLALGQTSGWDGASEHDTGAGGATPPALIDDVAAGDWVTLAGESVVIPIPDVLHYALASFVAGALAKELGQAEAEKAEKMDFAQEMGTARAALSPRSRGESRPITNRASPSRARRRYR